MLNITKRLLPAGRLLDRLAGILHKFSNAICIAISLFFLGSFVLATSIFYNALPTGDYLVWLYDNYNDWPQTLWTPYNQHRLVLAKLTVWVDSQMLHGAFWPVAILTECMVLLILTIFMVRIAKLVRDSASRWIIFATICLCLLRGVEMSLVCYPSNINHVFVAFFFMLGLAVIFSDWSKRHRVIALAVLCGICIADICSAADGLVALPVFLIFFSFNFRWLTGSLFLAALSGALIAVYLHSLNQNLTDPTVHFIIPSPWSLTIFVVNYIGAPWKFGAIDFSNGTYIGAALTILAGLYFGWRLITLRMPSYSLEAFAVAILMFGTGGGVLVAIGRNVQGLIQARSWRFFTSSEMMQCAVLILLLTWLTGRYKADVIRRFAVLALVIISIFMLPEQIKQFASNVKTHRMMETVREQLIANPGDPSAISALGLTAGEGTQVLALMKAQHIYGF